MEPFNLLKPWSRQNNCNFFQWKYLQQNEVWRKNKHRLWHRGEFSENKKCIFIALTINQLALKRHYTIYVILIQVFCYVVKWRRRRTKCEFNERGHGFEARAMAICRLVLFLHWPFVRKLNNKN
jgi:hypothetical protein